MDEIVSEDKFFHKLYPIAEKTGHVRAKLLGITHSSPGSEIETRRSHQGVVYLCDMQAALYFFCGQR